jgi:hypothetical protein
VQNYAKVLYPVGAYCQPNTCGIFSNSREAETDALFKVRNVLQTLTVQQALSYPNKPIPINFDSAVNPTSVLTRFVPQEKYRYCSRTSQTEILIPDHFV